MNTASAVITGVAVVSIVALIALIALAGRIPSDWLERDGHRR